MSHVLQVPGIGRGGTYMGKEVNAAMAGAAGGPEGVCDCVRDVCVRVHV